MAETTRTTREEARRVGDAIGVDWSRYDLEQFRAGMVTGFSNRTSALSVETSEDDLSEQSARTSGRIVDVCLADASYRRPADFFRASTCFPRARECQILHNRAAVNVSGQRLA